MTVVVHDWESLRVALTQGESCCIEGFRDDFRFLSNFFPSPIEFDRILFPTVEHAYQAAKADNRVERQAIAALPTPGNAKRAGAKLVVPEEWSTLKVQVMAELIRLKFTKQSELRDLLLATGECGLVEANNWGDKFWGICQGVGENQLGRLLMQARENLRVQDS